MAHSTSGELQADLDGAGLAVEEDPFAEESWLPPPNKNPKA
jgi:hypothetical protein